MKKKYVSPLFAELELEDVLFDSNQDNAPGNDADDPDWGDGSNNGFGDFDTEEDEFGF